jgi:lysophospholipase L1-like esterase
MIECIVLGDSIAVGTAHFRPECVALAKSGINSRDWNKQNRNNPVAAGTVIISLGSNDTKDIRTIWEVTQLRERVLAEQVFWILPANKPYVAEFIRTVAKDFGDTVLPIPAKGLSPDGVHPTYSGYRDLAKATR